MSNKIGTQILAFMVQEQKRKNCISYITALLAVRAHTHIHTRNLQEE
jgi:hypothetical protein